MQTADASEGARLRAFVDAHRRDVEQAERAYDVRRAALALTQLARPLTHPNEFHTAWKRLYLDLLYRDVTKFVLTFVAAHVLPGFSAAQRSDAFDVFFVGPHVPAVHATSALLAQIAATKSPPASLPANAAADEAAQTLALSVRLLQHVLDAQGVRRVVDQLLQDDERSAVHRAGRSLAAAQPTVSSLCSVPDLVFNRLKRATPSFFSPRAFHGRLCEELLDGLLAHGERGKATDSMLVVCRLFTEKLARIGHMEHFVRAWIARADLYDPNCAAIHRALIGSLPIAAYEPFLQYLAGMKAPVTDNGDSSAVVSSPQYLLLSMMPAELCVNKQFQFIVAHKLLLAKPVRDPVFLRMLVDTLTETSGAGGSSKPPLHAIFDVVVNRWCSDAFPLTADVGLNSSISLFLCYAMTRMNGEAFVDRDWTMKLCKGVQAHMAHSVERVRLLGMRVGESVSMIMSPEQPLNFEIPERDPLEECLRVQFDFSAEGRSQGSTSHADQAEGAQDGQPSHRTSGRATTMKPTAKKKKGLAGVDPDEVVDSEGDDESGDEADEDENDDESGAESDSDMSLDAYDLADDESDLQAPRPVYIKDLLSGLHADDDREKVETALAEAETLLRKQPKDLHYNAKAVVQALLRLEDKYSTPNFITLRAKALAAACALSPAAAVPFLQKQALEREQLLQSRVDVLEAMSTAAQELSQTGMFRPNAPKNLLRDDLDSRTMDGLKTRRFGYRRDPLAPAKKNAFADHALGFFSPLLFGYVQYTKSLDGVKRLSEVEDVFLAHLLHALSTFVECAGHAPAAVPMAKGLLEYAWHYRSNGAAAVRRQVLFAFSRVLLVMPPFLLRQELGQNVVEMMAWLQDTRQRDPDDGCREASRLLLSSGAVPMLTMP